MPGAASVVELAGCRRAPGPSPSSRAEQSIPSDTSPRIFRFSSVRPPGQRRADRREGILLPGGDVGRAAHHVARRAAAVVHRRRGGAGRRWGAGAPRAPAPTTTCARPGWSGSIASTAAPSAARRRATSCGVERAAEERLEPAAGDVHLARPRELREEAHVALVEQADVGNAVAQHGDALRPHAEGEAGVPLGVDAAVLEHLGMHHAAAEDLHPAGALAGGAAAAAAELAAHVHLGRRLGEREERGPEAHLGGRREELPREVRQRRLEVHEGDALVHGEPLDLRRRPARARDRTGPCGTPCRGSPPGAAAGRRA